MIKFHVVKEAKEAVLYFVQDFWSNLQFIAGTAKCIDLSILIDYSTYFKDAIQYYYCQFSPVSAWKGLLTIEISQIQFILVSTSA